MSAIIQRLTLLVVCIGFLCSCSTPADGGAGRMPPVRSALLPPNVHGRLVARTMTPRYITIHGTENLNSGADNHARYLFNKGKRSGNRRFGRSGWVTWHFTVDDREIVQHLQTTEQGDHADFGKAGDRQSIGIEICEFSDPRRQALAIKNAAVLAAALANKHQIPTRNIVPHKHWARWDFKYGKPCPKILLERDRNIRGGWYTGSKWKQFIARIKHCR